MYLYFFIKWTFCTRHWSYYIFFSKKTIKSSILVAYFFLVTRYKTFMFSLTKIVQVKTSCSINKVTLFTSEDNWYMQNWKLKYQFHLKYCFKKSIAWKWKYSWIQVHLAFKKYSGGRLFIFWIFLFFNLNSWHSNIIFVFRYHKRQYLEIGSNYSHTFAMKIVRAITNIFIFTISKCTIQRCMEYFYLGGAHWLLFPFLLSFCYVNSKWYVCKCIHVVGVYSLNGALPCLTFIQPHTKIKRQIIPSV